MPEMTVTLDASHAQHQLRAFRQLLPKLPKRRSDKFVRKLLRLVAGGSFLQLGDDVGRAAASTGDRVFRLGILGLDELIAAAFRAANLDCPSDGRHAGSPGVDEVGVGTADSTFGGAAAGSGALPPAGPDDRAQIGPLDV